MPGGSDRSRRLYGRGPLSESGDAAIDECAELICDALIVDASFAYVGRNSAELPLCQTREHIEALGIFRLSVIAPCCGADLIRAMPWAARLFGRRVLHQRVDLETLAQPPLPHAVGRIGRVIPGRHWCGNWRIGGPIQSRIDALWRTPAAKQPGAQHGPRFRSAPQQARDDAQPKKPQASMCPPSGRKMSSREFRPRTRQSHYEASARSRCIVCISASDRMAPP